MRRIIMITILSGISLVCAGQTDSLVTELLNASVITEGNMTYKIDRTTHFFTKEQISHAREARDLVSEIPGLFIDQQSNSIKTVGSKNVLVLINGVRAEEYELQLISPEKVRKVDYYDVPPVKYMDEAAAVINVHTSRLDTGWAGNFYGRGGQLYSNARASLGYVIGYNKFTLDLGAHINPKRDVQDTEEGLYSCLIGGQDYKYDYVQKSQDWGRQYVGTFTWLNARDNDYTLQAQFKLSDVISKMERTREIELDWGNIAQNRVGRTNDVVKNLYPVADIYFSKILSPSSTLTFDVVGTTYRTLQNAVSSEYLMDGSVGYTDNIDLRTRKSSVIGEINYLLEKDAYNLNIGYKGSYNWLRNEPMMGDVSYINTSSHRIYGEFASMKQSFSYRFSLGATANMKFGDNGFSDIAFTPTLLLGYGFNQKHYVRLRLDSETMMPGIQQMSDNKIMIMEGFYRTGNENLKNSIRYGLQFLYAFNLPNFAMTADMHYSYTDRQIFESFVDGKDHWALQSMNANYGAVIGSNIILTYVPWNFLMLSIDGSADYQTFKASPEAPVINHWFFPIYGNISLGWKGFELSYRHTLAGQSLSGIYLEGQEKVSYLNLSWRHKNLSIGLQCLFPFADDKFKSETTSTSGVLHRTSSNLRSKNHEFGITLSWNFTKGKRKSSNKSIDNSDEDSGAFDI